MDKHMKAQIEIMNQQAKELAAVYHTVASKSGISDNEFWTWYALLILGGEYSQQDICDLWSMPKQTVNSVISNLSKKGYIVLETVPGTRNRKVIRVTEEGKKYGENIVMEIWEAEQRALSRLTEEERQLYITLMGKFINIFKEEVYE